MDNNTIVARYIHDLCSDMRRYAETHIYKAYRALRANGVWGGVVPLELGVGA
jgi:hypothetical protein